ncbi:MAG: hypothetical protein ABI831_26930 [Betaproteobacteria bacterium]
MRIIAHLISVLLLVPGIVVSVVLLGVGHLAAQANFFTLLTALLELLLAFLPVAFLLTILWFALALLGFSTRMRQGGAICVALIAAATSAYIHWAAGASGFAGDAGIHVPGACALIIAIWLASTDWADSARESSVTLPATRPAIAPPPPDRIDS